jgi:hypothetical protein
VVVGFIDYAKPAGSRFTEHGYCQSPVIAVTATASRLPVACHRGQSFSPQPGCAPGCLGSRDEGGHRAGGSQVEAGRRWPSRELKALLALGSLGRSAAQPRGAAI